MFDVVLAFAKHNSPEPDNRPVQIYVLTFFFALILFDLIFFYDYYLTVKVE